MPRSKARVAPRVLAGRFLAACIVGVSATGVTAARLGPSGAHALARPSETNSLVLGSAELKRNSPERRGVLEVAAEGLFDIFGFEVGGTSIQACPATRYSRTTPLPWNLDDPRTLASSQPRTIFYFPKNSRNSTNPRENDDERDALIHASSPLTRSFRLVRSTLRVREPPPRRRAQTRLRRRPGSVMQTPNRALARPYFKTLWPSCIRSNRRSRTRMRNPLLATLSAVRFLMKFVLTPISSTASFAPDAMTLSRQAARGRETTVRRERRKSNDTFEASRSSRSRRQSSAASSRHERQMSCKIICHFESTRVILP